MRSTRNRNWKAGSKTIRAPWTNPTPSALSELALEPPAPRQPAPGDQHAEPAQEGNETGDAGITAQYAPAGKDLGPVVLAAADERQHLRARIGHVAGDVPEILEQPHRAQRERQRLAAPPERRGCGNRKQQLRERAAINGDAIAQKQAEDRVAGFVQGEIGVVEQENPTLAGVGEESNKRDAEGGRNKRRGPKREPVLFIDLGEALQP